LDSFLESFVLKNVDYLIVVTNFMKEFYSEKYSFLRGKISTITNGFDLESLEAFFRLLDPMFKYAAEFRSLSWMRDETWELLKKYSVAYTIVDEPLLPSETHLTTDFAYFRWHGRGEDIWFDYRYSKEELEPWVPKIEEVARKVKRVYGYFNNHYHGYAPENCLQLLERLGLRYVIVAKEYRPIRDSCSQCPLSQIGKRLRGGRVSIPGSRLAQSPALLWWCAGRYRRTRRRPSN
jgi:hypothetical protein